MTDDRPLPGAVQIAECGGACDCGLRGAAQLAQLRHERDWAVQAGHRLANRLERAEKDLAALRADRSWQQIAAARMLIALGICGAIFLLIL